MPEFEPTPEQRKQVEILIGMGLSQREVALALINPRTGRGIDDETLTKHFAAELERGAAATKGEIVQSLYRKALGNGPAAITAAIWVTKCRYGWRSEEKIIHEIDGKSGVLVVPQTVSLEDWLRRQRDHDVQREQSQSSGNGAGSRHA